MTETTLPFHRPDKREEIWGGTGGQISNLPPVGYRMISIAVLVSDEDYAAGLEKYLSAGSTGDISYGVYTHSGEFEGFLGEKDPQVVVLEEGTQVGNLKAPVIRLIGEQPSGRCEGIGMYRSLEDVAKDITEEVAALLGKEIAGENGDSLLGDVDFEQGIIDQNYSFSKKTADVDVGRSLKGVPSQITCVCSPFGGAYASTYAFALASYYSKGGRTLFVSFDPFFNVGSVLPGMEKGGLGRLIYLLDGEADSVIDRCKIKMGALDCICGSDHWTDICDMSRAHAEKLLDQINKKSYKHIVLDTKLFGAASIPLLRSSDRIWVPCPTGERESERINDWKRQLNSIGVDITNVVDIEIPYDGLIKSGCEYGMLLKGRLGRFIEETEGKRYVR